MRNVLTVVCVFAVIPVFAADSTFDAEIIVSEYVDTLARQQRFVLDFASTSYVNYESFTNDPLSQSMAGKRTFQNRGELALDGDRYANSPLLGWLSRLGRPWLLWYRHKSLHR